MIYIPDSHKSLVISLFCNCGAIFRLRTEYLGHYTRKISDKRVSTELVAGQVHIWSQYIYSHMIAPEPVKHPKT